MADVRQHTTTSLTPQQIHEIGLAEVHRIHDEMDTVIRKADFQGDFLSFQTFLRTDSRFYFTDAHQLITAYRDLCKRIDPELSRLFGKLPRAQYGVRPFPDYRAPSETSARYSGGSLGGSRPGYFIVNTYKLESRHTIRRIKVVRQKDVRILSIFLGLLKHKLLSAHQGVADGIN